MPRPGSGGGVLQAIGKSLMEIDQTTMDLLVGQYQLKFWNRRIEDPRIEKVSHIVELWKDQVHTSEVPFSDAFVLV